jgi:hypothetical protein
MPNWLQLVLVLITVLAIHPGMIFFQLWLDARAHRKETELRAISVFEQEADR